MVLLTRHCEIHEFHATMNLYHKILFAQEKYARAVFGHIDRELCWPV